MKKILLLFLLATAIKSAAQVPNLYACNNLGMATFDLTVQTPLLLGSNPPAQYDVSYHLTMTDANTGTNEIVNPMSFVATTMTTIYARIQQNSSGTFAVQSFMLIVNSPPIVADFPDVVACESYTLPPLISGSYFSAPNGSGTALNDGDAITATTQIYIYDSLPGGCFDQTSFFVTISPSPIPVLQDGYLCDGGSYLLDSGMPSELNYQWSLNGVVISGANANTYLATTPGIYTVNVTGFSQCTGSDSATVYAYSDEPVTIDIDGYTVLASIGFSGGYTFVLDNGLPQTQNVFLNVEYGGHTLTISDICGNMTTIVFNISTPNAPEGATTQTFFTGGTLADLNVEGQNIQWYADASANRSLEVPLPLTTPLENNTTYYATQTIDGVESINRLPVLATLSLATENNYFKNLVFYPNPIVSSLNIDNSETIERVTVYNIFGQLVKIENFSSNQLEVDFSSISSGIYFVKLQSTAGEKVIKILKE